MRPTTHFLYRKFILDVKWVCKHFGIDFRSLMLEYKASDGLRPGNYSHLSELHLSSWSQIDRIFTFSCAGRCWMMEESGFLHLLLYKTNWLIWESDFNTLINNRGSLIIHFCLMAFILFWFLEEKNGMTIKKKYLKSNLKRRDFLKTKLWE